MDFFDIKKNGSLSYKFLLLSFVFSFLLLISFTVLAGWPSSVWGGIYAVLTPLYYFIILLFITTLLQPLLWLKQTIWVLVVGKTLVDLALIADFFLFRVYRFHGDLMFFNMLINDFKGVGISIGMVLVAIVVAAVVFAINAAVVIYLIKKSPQFKSLKVNSILFCLFLISQLIHIVGFEYKVNAVTKYTPYLPYYAPITSGSLMAKLQAKWPSVFPEINHEEQALLSSLVSDSSKGGLFKYPKSKLQCQVAPLEEPSDGSKNDFESYSEVDSNNDSKSSSQGEVVGLRPNILIFVAESWRQDALNADVTPQIQALSDLPNSSQFNNHLSGGSVTVNGMFSLLYGLNPTYRPFAESAPMANRSAFIKELENLGYDIGVYTSSNLEPFSLQTMLFGQLDELQFFNPMDADVDVNDAVVTERVIQDIRAGNKSNKPWFKLVFLTSSHHAYNYPDRFEKFTPVEQNPERFVFNPGMEPGPLVNRYKNSVHYIDDLFGQIWSSLAESEYAENTLTVVTSDHGEEFDDNKIGFWGHGNNFSRAQVAVPLVIHQGSKLKQALVSQGKSLSKSTNQLTGHVDVVPTIMADILACKNSVSDYASGFSLFNKNADRDGLVVASYIDTAYIMDNSVFSTNLALGNYNFNDMNKSAGKVNFQKLNKLKIQSTSMLNR